MSEPDDNHTAASPEPRDLSPSGTPSVGVQTTMDQMTDQLQTVIDAAERAAQAIRFDAEERARDHLVAAQRRADELTAQRVGLISDLTDDLVRHAGTVREHSEQMIRALENAINSVTSKLDQPGLTEAFPAFEGTLASPLDVGPVAAGVLAPPKDVSEPKPDAAEPISDEALLHATRLAVAGNDRDAIAASLRDEYGLDDPEPVVARVLGEA